jgi:hypothetical protein
MRYIVDGNPDVRHSSKVALGSEAAIKFWKDGTMDCDNSGPS